MKEKYLVFIIQAYEQKVDDGKLIDVCEIQIIAKTYNEALKRAQKIVSKPYYRLNMVIEKYVQKDL